MAAQLSIGKCWGFKGDEQPPYPAVEVTVTSDGRKGNISSKVDTGFNGDLAIGRDDAQRLRLAPKGTILVRSAIGERDVPVYLVGLSLSDVLMEYSTLAIGTERSLVGRRLLQGRAWLLDFREEQLCLAKHSVN